MGKVISSSRDDSKKVLRLFPREKDSNCIIVAVGIDPVEIQQTGGKEPTIEPMKSTIGKDDMDARSPGSPEMVGYHNEYLTFQHTGTAQGKQKRLDFTGAVDKAKILAPKKFLSPAVKPKNASN